MIARVIHNAELVSGGRAACDDDVVVIRNERRHALFVVDVDAARIALRARAIRCPQHGCSGRLRPWSPARPCHTVTRWPGELVRRLAPGRGMCVVCRVSQTLLPAWYVPRRSASIEVVGAVVSAFVNYGHRPNRIAEVLRMPSSTVRAWVHRLPEARPCSSN